MKDDAGGVDNAVQGRLQPFSQPALESAFERLLGNVAAEEGTPGVVYDGARFLGEEALGQARRERWKFFDEVVNRREIARRHGMSVSTTKG